MTELERDIHPHGLATDEIKLFWKDDKLHIASGKFLAVFYIDYNRKGQAVVKIDRGQPPNIGAFTSEKLAVDALRAYIRASNVQRAVERDIKTEKSRRRQNANKGSTVHNS